MRFASAPKARTSPCTARKMGTVRAKPCKACKVHGQIDFGSYWERAQVPQHLCILTLDWEHLQYGLRTGDKPKMRWVSSQLPLATCACLPRPARAALNPSCLSSPRYCRSFK